MFKKRQEFLLGNIVIQACGCIAIL